MTALKRKMGYAEKEGKTQNWDTLTVSETTQLCLNVTFPKNANFWGTPVLDSTASKQPLPTPYRQVVKITKIRQRFDGETGSNSFTNSHENIMLEKHSTALHKQVFFQP